VVVLLDVAEGSSSLVAVLCCLMLRWHFDAGGGVMLLDVEMAVGHWWWCYFA
jgi:hypothetical protein